MQFVSRFLRRRTGWLVLAGLTMSGAEAAGTPPASVTTPHVRATLVASLDAVQPGSEIQLGIQQQIIPHWHTYWRNPGDSGVPTRIDWVLPKGAEAGEIQWPVPGRIAMGPVTNYGYEGEVTLLSRLKVPADIPVGGHFVLRATVNWLVCQEECIPEEVELGLALPVVASNPQSGAGSPVISRAVGRLPLAAPGESSFVRTEDGSLQLRLDSERIAQAKNSSAWFYPEQWGTINHSAGQHFAVDGRVLRLNLPATSASLAQGERLRGVLVIGEAMPDGERLVGFELVAPEASVTGKEELGVAAAMLFAFLGGIVLNLMPCVFPVLSIKALSLLKHAEYSPLQKRLQGLAYTAGVLFSFALLAGVLILLKAGGLAIGWGFQYQSPIFVLIVAYLMFGVGLNLSGLFTIGASTVGVGSSLAARGGYSGSFFTGGLATIVATPCTAPFMGAAIGYALSQSAPGLLAIFLSLGLGLAFPYLLLTTWPRLQRLLPRPGVWMERVKEALAFPMYGAAVWLVWVLAQQGGPNAVLVALGGMVLIGLAGWLYAVTRRGSSWTRHGGPGFAALAVFVALVGGGFGVDAVAVLSGSPVASEASEKHWQPYSAERLRELRQAGKPAFVNMTAAWCISCLVNERVALSDSSVIEAFKASGIVYLKGDWTNQDRQITAYLGEFGRSGVPLYVYYPPGADSKPVVLPQLLTPDTVRQTLLPVLSPTIQKESS
ncbi:protein-disulfide reductase DsbD family protein [Dechloromonas denitrificans]|uniref:protein-disulfide reductase DsbD family protein n=1 Tax=Dechloromonas denitrificans TaxID=281362 RepID=UPI001CF9B9C6|nr:protein-disulfide reductase DsbD domain-containing protein [Dechloromonas denitrificans]UCV06028.1 thioredoxin family protein [Dechloromonas denitrificans]